MTAEDSNVAPKRRRPRPSRGKGLRTTAGCLTCRKRRLKCDEARPRCNGCLKAKRDCAWPGDEASDSPADAQGSGIPGQLVARTSTDGVHVVGAEPSPRRSLSQHHIIGEFSPPIISPNIALSSPLTTTSSLTPGGAPFYWYDLLAEDAVRNIDNYDFLKESGSRWSFESGRSRRPSVHEADDRAAFASSASRPDQEGSFKASSSVRALDPWNGPVTMTSQETALVQHYVSVIAPILDLFDPQQHFTIGVVHLAYCNEGLLKSILALSALHQALCAEVAPGPGAADSIFPPATTDRARGSAPGHSLAVQYYYETLNYLSQAMKYPGYAYSLELLANAALISWYEAFDSNSSTNWERHLKGVFWIQRSQDNDGEKGGLRQAIWWNWLRLDVWAAFRHSRKTLTIWRPTRSLQELTPDEVACRIVYIQAKVVGYASDEARRTADFALRHEEGEMLLQALQDWHDILPASFRPMPTTEAEPPSKGPAPIWIHPPMHAAAMQAYYASLILVLLNKPSLGGRHLYHDNQKTLDDCVMNICGIAIASNASYLPLAIATTKALFMAGQCVRTKEQQEMLLEILNRSLNVTRVISKGLLIELQGLWGLSKSTNYAV